MECFIFLTLMFVVLAIGVIAAAASQVNRSNKQSLWRALSLQFNGAAKPGGWFSRPTLRFRYGATHVLATTWTSSKSKRCPQVMISWPDQAFHLEVVPADGSTKLNGLRLGAPWFQQRFECRTNSRQQAETFLSPDVQGRINFLYVLNEEYSLNFVLSRGRLLIQKDRPIKTYDEWAAFVTTSIELYDQGMLTRAVGIDFVSENVNTENINCRVCGDQITTDMVFCRRCKTPHHRECWEYFGACSIYGCKEPNYITPRIVGPNADAWSPDEEGG